MLTHAYTTTECPVAEATPKRKPLTTRRLDRMILEHRQALVGMDGEGYEFTPYKKHGNKVVIMFEPKHMFLEILTCMNRS